MDNITVLNAILYVAENGCKWRRLPKEFGNWHSIYTRMNRWSKNGTLARIFERLQRERLISVKIEVVSLDSTSIKVHPDGMGALKKQALKPSENPEAAGQPNFIWLPHPLNVPWYGAFPPEMRETPLREENFWKLSAPRLCPVASLWIELMKAMKLNV